jgi:formate-dependent nitrite reductase membrane component NrfD
MTTTSRTKPKATEARLEEIRDSARREAPPPPPDIAVKTATGAIDPTQTGYYGLPLLKRPTWTWEVPLYFFLGGISGTSACIGFAAQVFQAPTNLIRVALWIGLIGASICPALLISDLGRPLRFLNMLRVFKWRSPMSMGSWILVGFSGCVFVAVVGIELVVRGYTHPAIVAVLWLGEGAATVTGLLLASYTGVLIGATAIPVWNQNRKLLPAHFLTSGLGGAAGILELAGFLIPATQILGFAASVVETGIEILLMVRQRAADRPLHHGVSGRLLLCAGVLEGPASLIIRAIWHSAPGGRYAAAICFLVGALMSRYAWILAGRESSHDTRALFELQRGK